MSKIIDRIQMMSPTINFRVLLLAVLPVTAVSIIFFGYFVKKQVDDIESNIVDKGKSLAVHLASASEYGISSGNMAILSPLIESVLTKNDVISITITNSQGTPLIQKPRTKNGPLTTSTSGNTHNRIFSQPIIQQTVDINDFEDTDHNMPPVIGWVIVEVSNEIALQNKQDAIFQTLSMTLLILVGSILLATRISRHITKPILSLTRAVNEIEKGNLNVSIEMHATGTLLTLEKGVHSMLQSIKSSHEKEQNTIEQVTKELQKSLKLLEQKNSELTITRQQALSENQEKSAFLDNISHAIKTSMNEISGFVKLLNNTDQTQEQTGYLYTIEQSATNLLRVINDVPDFSNIEAGKYSANNIYFNLEECIEDVLALTAPSAHEKGIEISSLYYEDTPKELFGAADRIRQILINLIGNAIKFSDKGTIMVRTMLESQKNETLQIRITVTDQGPGISEKDKAVIFNAFSQIDNSDTRQYDGAKRGLAIAKSLTEAMQGKIGVENNEDKGSTFWFTFECPFKNLPEPVNKNEHLPYHNKSVTLYDANELTRISLTHTFQRLGFEVTECLDIEDLCAPQKAPAIPDICVLSINSHEAVETTIQEFLQTHRNHVHSKILVIVSQSDPLILKTLRDRGADACLSKPFRHADFEKKLATIFRSPKNFYGQQTEVVHKPVTLTRLDGLNILIAEDNAINAKLIETILHRSGAIPTIVDNGEKAVAAFHEDKFDIILMDIHMPEMNGVDAARKIRETEPPSTRITILGLTAASQHKNGPLSQNPDFDEVLEKPIAVNALLTTITWWTHVHKSSKSNKPTSHHPVDGLGIDKSLSITLNEMLLRELPEAKEKLKAAHDSRDSRFLRNEVHRLLGGLAYCDFIKLHQLTLQYQVSLKADEDTMDKNFQKMIAEMDRLLTTGNP
ncbi:MAG: response regulator [Gammaproteobacteria bacterium]|nr:response regulator [Gammaproteobacteria bacterium]